MRIDLQIETLPLFERMDKGQRRLGYAVVSAINATAKRIQKAEFEEVRGAFQIRRPTFFFGTEARPGGTAARIKPFASVKQQRPFAEIAVQAPESRGAVSRRTLLPYFEEGGPRPIFTPGARRVAIPIVQQAARPSWPSLVPQQFTFAGMRMVAYRGGKKVARPDVRAGRQDRSLFGTEGRHALPEGVAGEGAIQWKGRHRTFILLNAGPSGKSGVFQRIGPRDIRMIYRFKSPRALERRMRWFDVANRTAARWFPEEMERETIKAIQHSRGIGL